MTLDAAAPPHNIRHTKGPPHELWQDREVLFRLVRGMVSGFPWRPGEYVIESLHDVGEGRHGYKISSKCNVRHTSQPAYLVTINE